MGRRIFGQKTEDYQCTVSCENLKFLQLECSCFLRSVVTDDETLINHCNHDTKQQSKW